MESIQQHTTGGPPQHAGNQFHYLYAATRAMELLQPDSGVFSVRLEGFGSGGSAEDALDVTVERRDIVEFIQVKWSSSQLLQPSDCWKIVKQLWSDAQQQNTTGRVIEITLFTNRSASQKLRRQLHQLELWKSQSEQDLRSNLENENVTENDGYSG